MRTRYLVAALFVAIVSALLLVRHEGYLGGRASGGPLKLIGGDAGLTVRRGEIAAFGLTYDVEGEPVRVQNLRQRFASPGLEVFTPRLFDRDCGCRFRRWPPPGGGASLEGTSIEGRDRWAIIGLRARRRGVYYAQGLITDYKRGVRRFRIRESGRFCVTVGVGGANCLGYTAPHKARVIEGGGPSRYGVKLRDDEGLEARIPAVGRHAIRITLANQTRDAIEVGDIELGEAQRPVTITSDASRPERFRLAPRGSRSVRIGFRFSGCGDPGLHLPVDHLQADLDREQRSIPLSVRLTFTPRPCS